MGNSVKSDFEWRQFLLKDSRALIDSGICSGTLSRLRERISKEQYLYKPARYVLFKRNGEEKNLLCLLSLFPLKNNPHYFIMEINPAQDFKYQDITKSALLELEEIFLKNSAFKILCFSENEKHDKKGLSEFLKALHFTFKDEFEDFFLKGKSFHSAELFERDAENYNYFAYFLPFGSGFLVVQGDDKTVNSIGFSGIGAELEGLLLLKAERLGITDEQGRIQEILYPCSESVLNQKTGLNENAALSFEELSAYLDGKKPDFHFKINEEEGSPFQKKVWAALKEIPYGRTDSYLGIARRIAESEKEARRLSRAVGHACASNPLCIVVPCHRVIGSDRSLTGFRGGLEFKARLLDMELMTKYESHSAH